MKIIESSVDILKQEPGVIGMFKHIERIARISYNTEKHITDTSYLQFCEMLKKRGHWACFEHGTVYLKIPKFPWCAESVLLTKNPQTRYSEDTSNYYITTNYRVILRLEKDGYCNNSVEFIKKYWSEPDDNFEKRITSHWILSRIISQMLSRHRSFVQLQESQRYIAYDKEKNGGEITFVLPQWIYQFRDELAKYIDPLTGQSREYLLGLSGVDLWNELICIDRTAASRHKFWKLCEDEYMFERNTEESLNLKPEDARGALCNDVKTELYLTGFEKDYTCGPKEGDDEKFGFLYLRTASDAHPDIRVLAKSLEEQIKNLK